MKFQNFCRALLFPGALLVPNAFLLAHGFEGDRFFPPTIQTDDPFAADELSFPTVSILHNPGDPALTREVDLGAEFDKVIFPRFALGFSGAYTWLRPEGSTTTSGFQNFTLSGKYQFLDVPEHEFVLSAGAEWVMGGTGSRDIGEESFSTYAPALFFGKGFGDLPESVMWLKPLAVTGELSQTLPSKAADPNVFEWGFALEYSLLYLEQHVKDTGLPRPFRDMIPLVEFALESPENRGGGVTTGSINPGVLWESTYFQLGAEVVVPINHHTGSNIGFVMNMQIYIDDLIPKLFGRPLIGGGTAK